MEEPTMSPHRRPRRSAAEKVEEAFADLSLVEQAALLDRLKLLHHVLARERLRANGAVTPGRNA